jgi:hypothetical protein
MPAMERLPIGLPGVDEVPLEKAPRFGMLTQ